MSSAKGSNYTGKLHWSRSRQSVKNSHILV